MTMTQLIGDLESGGWRFQESHGRVAVGVPSPRPPDADAILAELSRRNAEAAAFLRARADADRLRELLGLPEIPVFGQTPPLEGKLLPFPPDVQRGARSISKSTTAAVTSPAVPAPGRVAGASGSNTIPRTKASTRGSAGPDTRASATTRPAPSRVTR